MRSLKFAQASHAPEEPPSVLETELVKEVDVSAAVTAATLLSGTLGTVIVTSAPPFCTQHGERSRVPERKLYY